MTVSAASPVRRRGAWKIAVIVLVPVLCLAVGVVTIAHWLDVPARSGPRAVSDAAKIVSITIPAGWEDVTESDARKIVFVGSDEDDLTPVRQADIELLGSGSEDEEGSPDDLSIYVEVVPEVLTVAELHRIDVARGGEVGKTADPVPEPRTVAGWPAKTSTYYDDRMWTVTTIRTDDYWVTAVRVADSGTSRNRDLTEMREILATMTIRTHPR